MEKLDRKYYGTLYRYSDGHEVPEDQWIGFLVKDNAFAAILPQYRAKCEELGSPQSQLDELDRLIAKIMAWRAANPQLCKAPD